MPVHQQSPSPAWSSLLALLYSSFSCLFLVISSDFGAVCARHGILSVDTVVIPIYHSHVQLIASLAPSVPAFPPSVVPLRPNLQSSPQPPLSALCQGRLMLSNQLSRVSSPAR